MMTDDMLTRSRAIDEQLHSINKQLAKHDFVISQHDSVITKLDLLCLLVQQHFEAFDMIQNP